MNYDDYLDKQTDEHLIGCVPKAISHNEDFVPDYNCNGCLETDCEYWKEHNEEEI